MRDDGIIGGVKAPVTYAVILRKHEPHPAVVASLFNYKVPTFEFGLSIRWA
jgi:hypothetical protein